MYSLPRRGTPSPSQRGQELHRPVLGGWVTPLRIASVFRPVSDLGLGDAAVAVCPFYQSIPAELVEDFERDLVDAYFRLSGGTNVFNYQIAVLHGFAK
ncbi:hypothetical protein BIW11_13259 [Tropilaelaps mercedesae]|uniref:Uncharacterized protein n=1 Tax=Tropilaelaps mercedesae TaxID=418985 RepID=A0A1V9X304_9ACAR|nr:hypothetical protein BIW11_13259 [Tropilaelaps mercedesae]